MYDKIAQRLEEEKKLEYTFLTHIIHELLEERLLYFKEVYYEC